MRFNARKRIYTQTGAGSDGHLPPPRTGPQSSVYDYAAGERSAFTRS